MLRTTLRTIGWSVCLVACCAQAAAAAVPASDTLLPKSVRGYVSIHNVQELEAAWQKTQVGRLLDNPVMKPFGDDLRQQLKEKWEKSQEPLGLSIEDLRGVAGGELCVALVETSGRPGVVLLVDVTGHEDRAETVLGKIGLTLVKRGAKRTETTIASAKATTYDLPLVGKDTTKRQIIYCLKDGLLCAFTQQAAADDILKRLAGDVKDKLADDAAYQAVMKASEGEELEGKPHVRWFVRPIPLAEAIRTLVGGDDRRDTAEDRIRVLKNQGFLAIQGAGGRVTLATGPYGLLHRTMIYAPKPYELAMRMLEFPGGVEFVPPTWVPRDLATYTHFQWDMKSAFERFGTLFDEVYGEKGVFEDMIESVATDPNGPKINIRTDLVAHLGTRGVLVTDYKLPLATNSQRRLLAVEATNPVALAAAIERSMAGDPAVKKRTVQDHVVYEITTQEPETPTLEVQHTHDGHIHAVSQHGGEEERLIPNSAVTVADGMLYVATHIDLLEHVLEARKSDDTLAQDVEYQLVTAQLKQIAGESNCACAFIRMDQQVRLTYEMFRQGRLPETDTPFALLLNAMFNTRQEENFVRNPEFDGAKLPEFDVVGRYLSPSGALVINQDDGWLYVGFTLNKESSLTADVRADDAAKK